MSQTKLTIDFEDTILGESIEIELECRDDDPFFDFYLRREIQKLKRVSPTMQILTKLGSHKYSLKLKDETSVLSKLVVYGHIHDEYVLMVHPDDLVIDLKFKLAPLIDSKPEYIQMNYNTLRRLNNTENVMQSKCLIDSVVIMWWLESYDLWLCFCCIFFNICDVDILKI